MKKHMWKPILLLTTILLLVITVIVSVNVLQEKQKQKTETLKEQSLKKEKTIKDYKTGEVLSIQDAYKEAGWEGEIEYIAFICTDKEEKDISNELYYVTDKEVIKKVIDTVNNTKFEVANKNIQEYDEKYLWTLWLGTGDVYNIALYGHTTPWEGVTRTTFSQLYPASTFVYNDDFMWDYFKSGMLINDNIVSVLMEILENNIKNLTLEKAKELVSKEYKPKMSDFCQYYYQEMIDKESNETINKYLLADMEGYVTVSYTASLENPYFTITEVKLYNQKDELQEVLYQQT